MQRIPSLLALAFLLLPSLAPTAALAQGVVLHVDGASGSDTNDGLSPTTALATLTAATLSSLPVSAIHVHPGTYSPSSGEVLPLSLPPGCALVGVDGSAATVLDGAGAPALFDLTSGGRTLRGLSLRNAVRGVELSLTAGGGEPLDLEDLLLEQLADGVHAVGLPGSYVVTLRRVTARDLAGTALLLEVLGLAPASLDLTLADCHFRDCDRAVRATLNSFPSSGSCHVERSTFRDITGKAFECMLFDTATFRIADTLVASCGEGMELISTGSCDAQVRRCTFTRMQGAGYTPPDPDPSSTNLLWGSILWDNGDDIGGIVQPWMEFNLVQDGDGVGFFGNDTLDPRFLDPLAGDFRLAHGSPALDRLSPLPGTDADGRPRTRDADLDGIPATDLGALEHAALDGPARVAAGARLRVEAFGPPGGRARLIGSREPLLASPIATPFGPLDLDPQQAFLVTTLVTGPTLPGAVDLQLPPNSSLVGTTLRFQALLPTPGIGAGLRTSEVLEVLVTP